MTQDVPVVSMQKGKLQGGGGDAPDPGQVHSPPGAWPGSTPSPLQPPPSDWAAGEGADDIVTGPVPALKKLAGRYAASLTAKERLAFLRATVNRDQPLARDDLDWLLDYAEANSGRNEVILAALGGFCAGMADAMAGSGEAAP